MKIKLLDRKGKRIGKKKKTSVKMGNLNPYFNESFVFLVEQEQLRVIDHSIVQRELRRDASGRSCHGGSDEMFISSASAFDLMLHQGGVKSTPSSPRLRVGVILTDPRPVREAF